MENDDDDYETFDFNHRVEKIEGEPFLLIDLADGNCLMFTPENWRAFIFEGNEAIFAYGKQDAPVRMQ